MKKKRVLFRIAVFVVLFAAVLVTGFRYYTSDYYTAKEYVTKEKKVTDTEKYIVYGDVESETGFIFYPGAKVDEKAYAPIMDELAQTGICCVIVKMPYHMAIFDSDAAENVMQEIPDVKEWYIGGHSLGGAMAATYAAKHESALAGLILLAAYPTDELEDLPVLSIYGSEDKVLNREKYADSISFAKNLTERVIEGGNHAEFGNYGKQKGDGEADIPDEEQWQETVDYILDYMKQ